MALCDYRLCDRCGGKAFYDANLNYGDPGATRVRGQHYTLDHVGDWAVLCQTCAETHAVTFVVKSKWSGMLPNRKNRGQITEQEMIADGWRQCAVGQRDTQHCGMAEEARAQERARIVALIHEHIVRWQSGEYFGHELAECDDFDEVVSLKRLLSDVEDTSHE